MRRLIKDNKGVLRFEAHPVIKWLYDNNRLRDIDVTQFSDKDREEIAQLLGTPIDVYAELSYTSDESVKQAMDEYNTRCDDGNSSK